MRGMPPQDTGAGFRAASPTTRAALGVSGSERTGQATGNSQRGPRNPRTAAPGGTPGPAPARRRAPPAAAPAGRASRLAASADTPPRPAPPSRPAARPGYGPAH